MTKVPAVTLALLAAASVAVAATDTSSRYDIILKRQPFWNPPPPPQRRTVVRSTKPPVQAKSFVDTMGIRMCGITKRDDKIQVGFVARTGRGRNRTQKSYYLHVGETEGDFQVVSADFEAETAVLRNGTETATISMSEATSAASSGPAVASPAARVPTASRTRTAARSVPRPTSYRDILKKRQEERARRLKEEQARAKEREKKLKGEELQKHLQEYNLKLIRAKGELGPPLPIPLTPEQDAELVKEGVLPPRE